jgi:hypothetical protein
MVCTDIGFCIYNIGGLWTVFVVWYSWLCVYGYVFVVIYIWICVYGYVFGYVFGYVYGYVYGYVFVAMGMCMNIGS